MTVKEMSNALNLIKESLQDKEVKIIYPNGKIGSAEIKFVLKENDGLNLFSENVEYILITY